MGADAAATRTQRRLLSTRTLSNLRIREPKPRLISAAPFRDRVVHHAVTQVLEPIFERRFSPDSFACRKGLGTHRAIAQAKQGMRRYRFVLKCDVRKYFPSIDHEILKGQIVRVIKCQPTLDLVSQIIDGSNEQEEVNAFFPGDDLFAPYERRRGLPLGNQTSQFFANVYLNPLDQLINHWLEPGLYVRYVDDFLLFDDSRQRLVDIRAAFEALLCGLRLRIHPSKSRVYRSSEGITFWAGGSSRPTPVWCGGTWSVSGIECAGCRVNMREVG